MLSNHCFRRTQISAWACPGGTWHMTSTCNTNTLPTLLQPDIFHHLHPAPLPLLSHSLLSYLCYGDCDHREPVPPSLLLITGPPLSSLPVRRDLNDTSVVVSVPSVPVSLHSSRLSPVCRPNLALSQQRRSRGKMCRNCPSASQPAPGDFLLMWLQRGKHSVSASLLSAHLTWKIPQRGLLGSSRCWSTGCWLGGRREGEPYLASLHTDTTHLTITAGEAQHYHR